MHIFRGILSSIADNFSNIFYLIYINAYKKNQVYPDLDEILYRCLQTHRHSN